MTNSWLGKIGRKSTALTKPAASGSVQVLPWPPIPARAIVHTSAPTLVTVRGLLFKVAVSDVEENSVMTRVLIAFARIGCVTSAAAIVIAKSARRELAVLVFIE
jgi:hypothetical protein